MSVTPRWLFVVSAALIVVVSSCGGSPVKRVTSGPGTTGSSPPSVTEPRIDAARLQAILVPSAALPPGFALDVAPAGLLPKTLCGQPVVDTTAQVATAQANFARAADNVRVSEVLVSFAATADAKAVVAPLAGLAVRCPHDGATAVNPLQPPAVGEDVAGAQLSDPGRVVQVAVIRSGVIDAIVVISAPTAIPADTLAKVVTAAGTALAIGTGG